MEGTKIKTVITEMPDKETLEAFLDGMHGPGKVGFNRDTGKFEWYEDRKNKHEY